MSQERFVAFKPRKTPRGNERTQENAAAKAQESAKNSHLMVGGQQDVAVPGRQLPPPDSTPTPSRLTKKMLQFPQNVQTGRPTPSHYIIFDRIKLLPGKGSQDDKSITLEGKTKSSVAQIALYMPASVNVGYNPKYSETAVGAGAELGLSIAESIKDIAGAKGQTMAAAMKEVPKLKTAAEKGLGDAGNAVVFGALTSAVGILPGMSGVGKVAQLRANKVITDKMELFFEGVGRREFKYEFTFIPTSAEDSRVVNDIVNEFKSAMLPEYTSGLFTDAISDRTLTVPDLFDIKYMYLDERYLAKENRYLNKITSCYLTNMEVNYGSDRYTAYRPDDFGAPPQNTSISLSFQEVEIVTRERAEKGF